MPKQPLTPTGVQDKQDELYLLADPALQIEAEAVRTDFRGWMDDNFDLTPSQVTYLDNLPDDFVHPLSCNTSAAIEFRLPITLTIIGTVSVSKMIRTNPALEYLFSPIPATGGYVVTGTLDIIFEYL